MGQFKDNKMNGKGTYLWGPDTTWAGDKYIGDWVDDARTGQGVYIYSSGNHYELRYSQTTRRPILKR